VELPVPITISDQQAAQKRWGENEEGELFSTNNYLPRLFAESSKYLPHRKSLLFWPNCTSSMEATKHYQSLGFQARHIEGEGGPAKMTKKQIQEVLEWFKEPGERVLSNCELLSTGFDQPDIDQVGIMRVIRSIPLIKQMVGRGTRTACVVDGLSDADARKAAIAASKKPKLRVLDLMIQLSSIEHTFADVTALITEDKAEREFIREQQRQAGRQLSIEEIESKLKAKRETDRDAALAKLAEDAANAARKAQQQRTIFVGDILAAFNPAHKPATPGARKELEWKIRHGNWIVPIGERPLSMYQIIRIKERIEQRAEKIARLRKSSV